MAKSRLTVAILLLSACTHRPPDDGLPPRWEKLETEPANDKQDDVCFIDSETGWYVNSIGKIFKTVDGGRSWAEQVHRPGTYWRALAFIDRQRGFAGNLGPGAVEGFSTVMAPKDFENLNSRVNITDPNLIYETTDGGRTWAPSKDPQEGRGGICSMNVFIDRRGRKTVWAGGRVTGPGFIFRWTEENGWDSMSLRPHCGMVLDILFLDADTGVVCAATDADPAKAFASILRTEDGGLSWSEVYRSTRPGESVWKCSFPTRDVGYATIRSFNPDPKATPRFVVKTVDGGRTWKEILLVDDYHCRPQAVAFLTPERGWVGTTASGFETRDGGASWTRVELGRSINRIRIVKAAGGGHVLYAIGQDLCKLRLP